MKFFTKHYVCVRHPITEGGASRLSAFIKLLSLSCSSQHIYSKESIVGRLINMLHMFGHMLSDKNEVVLIHYSNFPLIFTQFALGYPFVSRLIGSLINYCAQRNRLYVEVNDLPFEQAVDLALKSNKMNIFDSILFSKRNINFIFASKQMSLYVQHKYNIEPERISVIINGSWPITVRSKSDSLKEKSSKLRFVYAGTLNKGRQILQMIDIFANLDHTLTLLGADGAWLTPYIEKNKSISYLGPVPEDVAHKIVSECDVGIIPYDNTLFYYNMCYPTKASFYVTAGITFISSPLHELQNHFSDDAVLFCPVEGWRTLLTRSDIFQIVSEKSKIIQSDIADGFSWNIIWKNWLSERN